MPEPSIDSTVGESVKFGRMAKLFWENEEFFLKVRIDRHC